MFDNFNSSNSSGRVEENEDLKPLDEFGNPKDNNTNNNQNMNNNGNKGSLFSKFGGNNGGDGGGSWFKAILGFAIVGALLFLMFNGGESLTALKRFVGTPTENTNELLNSIKELEAVNKAEGDFDTATQKKELLDEFMILEMPQKEYLVYIYTGKPELDKNFSDFVNKNQKKIPTHKINYLEVNDNIEVKVKIEGEFKPYLLVVKDLGKGAKVIDAVIDNEKQLKNVPTYFDDLVKENNFEKSDEIQYDK